MTDQILVTKYESRLGEAESKRQAITNKYNAVYNNAQQLRKSVKEAMIFFQKLYGGQEIKMSEVAGLRHMMQQALVVFDTGIDANLVTKREFWSMPDDPKTNDLFFDGEDYLCYYLGRWNKVNPTKG